MDFKNISPKFNFEKSTDSDDFIASITHQLYTQIVKEEDERTMLMIEEYIKSKQAESEIIAAKFIPEGKLRHIINLGLTRLNNLEHYDMKPGDLFPQEQYIEYLRREIVQYQQENQRLKNQINIMESMSGLRSVDTEID